MADDFDFEPDPAPDAGAGDVETTEPETPSVPRTEKSDGVILAITAPPHLNGFKIPHETGSHTLFDRVGALVPAGKVEEYKERAAASGVTLSEKEG